jgi:hypothetical protein
MDLKKGVSDHRPSGIKENFIGIQVHKEVWRLRKRRLRRRRSRIVKQIITTIGHIVTL